MLPENEASILDRTAKAESLDELREALDVLRTWKYEGVAIRADQPTSLTFASNVATLTACTLRPCGHLTHRQQDGHVCSRGAKHSTALRTNRTFGGGARLR